MDCAHHVLLGRRLRGDGLHPSNRSSNGLEREHTFYALRFLLGFAEAGFFPGIIFFLILWFPAAYRARIVSYFMAAIPLSYAVSSPVSAALLGLEGAAGLRGWQWLFIVEAIPSILLAFAAYFYLTDRPADARWLPGDRRRGCKDVSPPKTRSGNRTRRRTSWQGFTTIAFLRCRSSISAAWHAATA